MLIVSAVFELMIVDCFHVFLEHFVLVDMCYGTPAVIRSCKDQAHCLCQKNLSSTEPLLGFHSQRFNCVCTQRMICPLVFFLIAAVYAISNSLSFESVSPLLDSTFVFFLLLLFLFIFFSFFSSIFAVPDPTVSGI